MSKCLVFGIAPYQKKNKEKVSCLNIILEEWTFIIILTNCLQDCIFLIKTHRPILSWILKDQ